MRKITLTKQLPLLVTLFCVINFGHTQTTLSAGDVAITGFNSDYIDGFTFVILTDITTGTTINFTDDGWRTSGNFRNGNEGLLTWTATTDLPCGTEVYVDNETIYDSNGIGIITDSNFFTLGSSGDQIFVFQGTKAAPSFIFGLNYDDAGWSEATNTSSSALPPGLTDGVTAVLVPEFDNGAYNCAVTSNPALILAGISTSTNWNMSNSIFNPLGGCGYTCGSCSSTVTWNGTAWSATPDLTTEAIINADYNTGADGSFSACSLTVTNSATLDISDNGYIEVENDLTVDTGGEIVVQPYGAFVQNNDSGLVTNNGIIKVEKRTSLLNNWYEYTYWSSPVENPAIGVALAQSEPGRRFVFNGQNFLDATAETANNNAALPGQDDIDDNGDDWQFVNGSTPMEPGIGYAATHSEAFFIGPPFSTPPYQFIFEFEGDFNNGVYNVPIYRNDSELNDNNWNLIGNPYPSAINADLFLAANSNVDASVTTPYTIDGAIFMWSQDTAPNATTNGNEQLNFSDADYAIINGTGESAGGDSVTPNRFIPSGQAFFVSMSNAASASLVSGDVYTANVAFNNSMRVFGATDNSQFFKNSNTKKNSTATTNKLWVNLTSDNGVFNQILIGYINGATNDDDGAYYDARKIVAPTAYATLYSSIENSDKKFAIQGKAANSLNVDEVIKLGFSTNIDVATLYTLSLAQFEGDFLNNNPIILKDNLLNTVHELSASDYSFTSETGEFNDRFEVVFSAASLSTDELALNSKALKIVELDDDNVQFTTSNNLSIKSVSIFDLLGRQLYDFKGNNNTSETYTLSNLSSTIFIAKVELSNGTIITKKAVKK